MFILPEMITPVANGNDFMDKYGVIPKKSVCPKCGGKGCKKCDDSGRRPSYKNINPVKESKILKRERESQRGQC